MSGEMVPAGCEATIQHGARRGERCNAVVVEGYPLCYQHMNQSVSTPRRAGTRYSSNLPEALRQSYHDMLDDGDPKNLLPEIANLRMLVGQVLEQASAIDEEGNVSVSKKDMEYVYAGYKLIGEMVEKQSKINPEKYIPVDEVLRIIKDIVGIFRSNMPPDLLPLREKISAEIQRYCMNQIMNRAEEDRNGTS